MAAVPRETITSLQNARVKEWVRLRDRRGRRDDGPILIDGRREISRGAEAGIRLRQIVMCPAMLGDEGVGWAERTAASAECRLIEVTQPVFEKLAYGERAEGVLATADRPAPTLDGLNRIDRPLIAVVDGIEKPGNLGAIARSADGAGVDAILAIEPRTDIYGPNAIRASMGTVFCVPMIETTSDAAMRWLRDRGVRIVAASPEATTYHTDVDLTGAAAIVLGSEALGLSEPWRRAADATARLPMRGRADSLNVSVTAALFFYEALRQRAAARRPGREHRASE